MQEVSRETLELFFNFCGVTINQAQYIDVSRGTMHIFDKQFLIGRKRDEIVAVYVYMFIRNRVICHKPIYTKFISYYIKFV